MVPFAGDVYLTNRQGAVLSTAAAAVVNDDGASQGRRCRRSAQSISMATGHCVEYSLYLQINQFLLI
jgi:hypothetical protein